MKKTIQLQTLTIFLFSILTISLQAQNWDMLGAEINGDALDQFGYALDLSNDGTTLIVGSPTYTEILTGGGFEYEKGNIKTYIRNGNGWTKFGSTIEGANFYDQLGTSVGINSDGSIIAVGIPFNDDFGEDAGQVQLYQRTGTGWNQKGSSILGQSNLEQFGRTLNLSADGNTLAVGAPNNGATGSEAGQVRLYEWDGSDWAQKGTAIDGTASSDHAGFSLSLSSDGTTVSIGAPDNDDSSQNAGQVRTYEWDGAAWAQKGSTMTGSDSGDFFGYSVSISGNGNLLAVGAPNNSDNYWKAGQVKIFEWNGSAWAQKGGDLNGEVFEDRFGQSLSFSSDGQSLAIGAPLKHVLGAAEGQVRIYDWDQGNWAQRGGALSGTAAFEDFGAAISLSDDRRTIAIGAPDNNDIQTQNGKLTVFEWDMALPTSVKNNTAFPVRFFPNPCQEVLNIDLGKDYQKIDIEIQNIYGQTVGYYSFDQQREVVLEMDGAAGLFLIVVRSERDIVAIMKVVKG